MKEVDPSASILFWGEVLLALPTDISNPSPESDRRGNERKESSCAQSYELVWGMLAPGLFSLQLLPIDRGLERLRVRGNDPASPRGSSSWCLEKECCELEGRD